MNKDTLMRMGACGTITTSVTHHTRRINWPAVIIGIALFVAAVVVIVAQER